MLNKWVESIPELEELDSSLLGDDWCSSKALVLMCFGAGVSIVAGWRMVGDGNWNAVPIGPVVVWLVWLSELRPDICPLNSQHYAWVTQCC